MHTWMINFLLEKMRDLWGSPKRLKKDVLAKDEAESKKPNWLLMDFVNDHRWSIQGATWGTAIWHWHYAYLEGFDGVWERDLFGLVICPLQASLLLSSKQTV
ncbi:hypothetical protein CMV_026674 [Castanea mollissima]|uniref:Uncharacterized protein n=1 Tax=Castanea mollissima TaxID=60419 RepID=A0A8J4VA66_9ROSI|nr:hypothetical protein CMV_026674 [Castanea mollissima]